MSVTLSDMRTRVRRRADKVNSPHIKDAELTTWIGDSYAELYDLLVGAFEDYNLADPYSFTISSGDTADLPSDFYKLRGVDLDNGGSWVGLEPFQFRDRNSTGGLPTDVGYRLRGSKIWITPSDQAAGSYRLWYIPVATIPTADSDTMDGVNGWELYIELDAAIKCLQKEESETGTLFALKQEQKERIIQMSRNRDAGSPSAVVDVQDYNYNIDWSPK